VLWQQIALVVAISTAVAWLSRFWAPGPWNVLVWLAPPIIIAFVTNKNAARVTNSLLLTLTFVAVLVGNEAVAHLVFGTCLYD
jgi:hypothetical protein